jgi:hypothetical protein
MKSEAQLEAEYDAACQVIRNCQRAVARSNTAGNRSALAMAYDASEGPLEALKACRAALARQARLDAATAYIRQRAARNAAQISFEF